MESFVFNYKKTTRPMQNEEWYVVFFDLQKNKNVTKFPLQYANIDHKIVALSSKAVVAVVGSSAEDIKMIDVSSDDTKTWKNILVCSGVIQQIRTLVFANDGKMLISADDRIMQFWDAANGKPLQKYQAGFAPVINPFKTSIVAFGLFAGDVKIWNVDKNIVEKTYEVRDNTINYLCFSSQKENRLAIGGYAVSVLDTQAEPNKMLINKISGFEHAVWCLSFHPKNEKILVAGHADGTISVLDIEQGSKIVENLTEKHGFGTAVSGLCFGPDGTWLASASWDSTISFWNTSNQDPGKWACIKESKEHSDRVMSLALSYDGKYLASASQDRTIKIWNMETLQCVATLQGSEKELFSAVCFSPVDYTLASGSAQKFVRIWHAKEGSIKENVGSKVVEPTLRQLIDEDNKRVAMAEEQRIQKEKEMIKKAEATAEQLKELYSEKTQVAPEKLKESPKIIKKEVKKKEELVKVEQKEEEKPEIHPFYDIQIRRQAIRNLHNKNWYIFSDPTKEEITKEIKLIEEKKEEALSYWAKLRNYILNLLPKKQKALKQKIESSRVEIEKKEEKQQPEKSKIEEQQ